MAIADPSIKDAIDARFHYMEWVAPIVGAIAVVLAGRMLAQRKAKHAQAPAANRHEEAA